MRNKFMGSLLAICGISAGLVILALSQCRKKAAEEEVDIIHEDRYIGNIGNMKLHLPTCHVLPDPKNRIAFKSRSEALDAGYSPCSLCRP
ncbi:MAG: Ada metal-binding domain-containing protein [Bacillota bacterium]|nr:Ada metal-binding domain-containing protein [Bacillota bacterium]